MPEGRKVIGSLDGLESRNRERNGVIHGYRRSETRERERRMKKERTKQKRCEAEGAFLQLFGEIWGT